MNDNHKWMKSYKKVENCGPVPYPDGSGRMLLDGEVVVGDEWERYVALGYVAVVETKPKNKGGRPRKVRPDFVDPGKSFPEPIAGDDSSISDVSHDNSSTNAAPEKKIRKHRNTV